MAKIRLQVFVDLVRANRRRRTYRIEVELERLPDIGRLLYVADMRFKIRLLDDSGDGYYSTYLRLDGSRFKRMRKRLLNAGFSRFIPQSNECSIL